jgi:hypothetical protein
MYGMQLAYTACAYFAGLLLDVLVIVALVRNGYRRFPFVLIYVVVDFLTSVIELQPVLASNGAKNPELTHVYTYIYYWNERIIQVLIFLIVISMVHGAIRSRARRTLLPLLIAATGLFAGVTFAIHFDAKAPLGTWMIPWTRDLNFGAAVLDLGLWTVLIASREKDYRTLMVAGGLGIQFTGGAIGQAFRGLSPTGAAVMSALMYLTNLMCLYMWWQAFRQPPKPKGKGPDSPPVPLAKQSAQNAASK